MDKKINNAYIRSLFTGILISVILTKVKLKVKLGILSI